MRPIAIAIVNGAREFVDGCVIRRWCCSHRFVSRHRLQLPLAIPKVHCGATCDLIYLLLRAASFCVGLEHRRERMHLDRAPFASVTHLLFLVGKMPRWWYDEVNVIQTFVTESEMMQFLNILCDVFDTLDSLLTHACGKYKYSIYVVPSVLVSSVSRCFVASTTYRVHALIVFVQEHWFSWVLMNVINSELERRNAVTHVTVHTLVGCAEYERMCENNSDYKLCECNWKKSPA
jgi:hypothetical protein